MTWALQTLNTENINLINYPGLDLFSTISSNPPVPLVILRGQAISKEKRSYFETTTIQELPQPSDSKLYVVDGLYKCSLPEIWNIHLITPESFFRDYIESKTYIVTSNSSLALEGTVALSEDNFVSLRGENNSLDLNYEFVEEPGFAITKITSEGLEYNLNTIPGHHTFSFEDSLLVVHATTSCSPRPGSVINLEIEATLTTETTQYSVWFFDLNAFNFNAVDSLTYRGKSFMTSLQIGVGSLLYNRVSKGLLAVL